MSTEIASAYVSLIPSFKGGKSAIEREMGPAVDDAAGSIGASSGKKFGGAWGKALAAGAAVGGVMVLGQGLKNLALAGQESAAVAATTAQIIKSTGGAAKVTAAEVDGLASALSNKTGIDDEAIQSASNLLLTFKNVKNAGEGQAAMFDRATAAAVDLSKAGFGDMNSAAKMLGKALNDPEKGITALSRAGVTFTDQQKDQIKALVASGDTLKAQNLIMKEVESQVGGVAEATRSPIEAMQMMFGNLQESVGGALLPTIDILSTTLGPVIESLGGPLATIAGALGGALTTAIGSLAPVLPVIVGAFADLLTALSPLLELIGPLAEAFMPLIDLFVVGAQVIAPIVAQAVEFIMQSDLLRNVLIGVTAAVVALNIAMSLNPIGAVILAIIALVGAIKLLWDNNETFRRVVTAVWEAVKTAIAGMVNWFKGTAWPAIMAVLDALKPAFEAFKTVVAAVWKGIQVAAGLVVDWFQKVLAPAFGVVMSLLKGDFSGAADGIKTVWSGLISFFGGILGKFKEIGAAVINGIKSGISIAWESFKSWFIGLLGQPIEWAKSIFGIASPSKVFAAIGSDTIEGFRVGMSSKASAIKDATLAIGRDVIDAYAKGMRSEDPKAREAARKTMVEAVEAAYQETLGKLQQNVTDIQNQMSQFATSVSSSIMRVMDFGAAFSQVGTEGGVSFMDALRLQAEQAKLFADRVRELVTMGLSQAALQQVLAAGVTAGTSIATELINGGTTAIDETNALVTSAQGAADEVGLLAATSYYNAGVKDAQATVQAFVDHFGKDGKGRDRLMSLMNNLANSMNRTATITVTTVHRDVYETVGAPTKGRAAGGPVMANEAYWVGEKGPEILVMGGRSGTIIPNHEIGQAVSSGAQAPGADGSGGPTNVRVFIGDRELTDIVRIEMDDRDLATVGYVNSGSRV